MAKGDKNRLPSDYVKQLSSLAQCQQGSIVSRVLLWNTGGTVTLFAFSQGERLSEHTAPFDALLNVIEGEAEVDIDTAKYRLRAGEIITLPAHRPHAVRATTDFKMLLIMIRHQN